MKLIINGKEELLSENKLTISDLLRLKNVKMPEMVSVELNGNFLNKQDFDTKVLKNDDQVEFLYFMGGGSSNTNLWGKFYE